ncbi:hypothetical protein HHI36_014153 [Cryptolaemus montrouzieri]|uniref:Uncharacterized protein n=1 Tax=Cryptolaemus montrouzieri TaxID=559131 RepID=A0ABD2N310_9CUCU
MANFDHIESAFNLDQQKRTFKMLPKLSNDYFNFKDSRMKMKVKVAAAQLSYSVAACIETWVASGNLPSEAVHTAEFVHKVDSLFDSLNGYSFSVPEDAAVISDRIDSLEILTKFRTHSNILVIINDIIHFNFSSYHHISLQQGLNIKVIQLKNQEVGNYFLQSNKFHCILYSTLGEKLFDTEDHFGNASLIPPLFEWDPLKELKKFNKSFQVVGFSCPPYVVTEDNQLTGLDIELIRLIFRNWPLSFIILENKTFPYEDMRHIVQNRTADMGSCASWLTLRLLMAKSEFSPYYHEHCFTFLVHKPSRLPDATFMFQCFQLSLWYLISFVICFVVVFITTIQRVFSESKIEIKESLIFTLNQLVGNSMEEKYTSSSRILKNFLILWSMCSLLFITYYNAGLTSVLQYPRVDLQINSIKDMVKKNIYWLEQENDGLHSYIRSLGGVSETIADLFIFEQNVTIVNKKIRTGKFAVPVEALPGGGIGNHEFLDEYGKSHMKILPECLMKHFSVYIMQSNSPYKNLISRKILEAISHGFVEILFKKVVDRKHKKIVDGYYSVYTEDVDDILSISKIQGGFWLLSILWLLGLICFIYEKYWKRNIIYNE